MADLPATVLGQHTLTPATAMAPAFDWNPIHWPAAAAASAAATAATDASKMFMTGLWGAALWVMGFVFRLEDAFLDPDLSASGPLRGIMPITLGVAVALFMVIVFGQLIVAAIRRDLSSLGSVVFGMMQFAAVNLMGLTYATAVMVGTSGLTHAILKVGLNVDSFGTWAGAESWPREVSDVAVSFVLGISAIFLVWPAAIAHLTVLLARAVALGILAATMPITAAGLVGESTKRWFWIAFRWFHAAAFIPALSALVLAIGVKTANATTQGAGEGAAAAGATLVGALTIAISAAAPLALFRLLAFVDPGTTTGQNFRAALGSYGGVSGLMQGKGGQDLEQSASADGGGDDATSATTSSGASAGAVAEPAASTAESSAAATHSSRMAGAMAGLSAAGTALSAGGAKMMSGLDTAITQGTDALNLSGVGNPQYYYGTSTPPRQHSPSMPPSRTDESPEAQDTAPLTGPGPDPTGDPGSDPGTMPSAPVAAPPAPPGGWSGAQDDARPAGPDRKSVV